MRYQLDKQTIMGELRRDRLFFDYSEQQLSADLEQLIRWKNLTAIQDPRKVRTVADFQNKQYQYMMSQAALEIERMTMTPENLYAHTQQTQLDSGIQQLKSMEGTAAKKEWKLRESKQTVQDCDRAFQADLRLLDDTNRTLMLGQEHDAFRRSLSGEQALRGALRSRKTLLGTGLDSIRTLRQAQERYDQAEQALDLAKAQEEKAEAEVRSAQRIQELEDLIQKSDQDEREADKQYVELHTRLSALEADVRRRSEELTSAVLTEMALEAYFKEELQLGLVEEAAAFDQEDLPRFARQTGSLIQAADRERTPEKVGEALNNNYQSHKNELLKYSPRIHLVFDPPEQPGMLRQRYLITLQKDGREMNLYQFIEALQADIDLTESVLEENDRRLFEDILLETISHKLRRRINESQKWCEDMTALMGTLNTSMGLRFSLDWKPRKAEKAEELDIAKLVSLLNKDRLLLTRQDSELVSGHFRAKVRAARETAVEQGMPANYADLIRSVLDYRTWYEFRLFYQHSGESKKELTNSAFSKFSGGEKAMAMYVPLFASVSAQYRKASESCPKLLALDEAFAGVDDQNIGAMFELVGTLDFDYIMNSQALWGCYPSVKCLNIVELHRPGNASFVTLLRYFWDGSVRVLREDGNGWNRSGQRLRTGAAAWSPEKWSGISPVPSPTCARQSGPWTRWKRRQMPRFVWPYSARRPPPTPTLWTATPFAVSCSCICWP